MTNLKFYTGCSNVFAIPILAEEVHKTLLNTTYYCCLHAGVFLQTAVVKARKLLPITDRYELVNMTLCDRRGEFHDLNCVDRCCEKCGVAGLEDLIVEDEVNVLGTSVCTLLL